MSQTRILGPDGLTNIQAVPKAIVHGFSAEATDRLEAAARGDVPGTPGTPEYVVAQLKRDLKEGLPSDMADPIDELVDGVFLDVESEVDQENAMAILREALAGPALTALQSGKTPVDLAREQTPLGTDAAEMGVLVDENGNSFAGIDWAAQEGSDTSEVARSGYVRVVDEDGKTFTAPTEGLWVADGEGGIVRVGASEAPHLLSAAEYKRAVHLAKSRVAAAQRRAAGKAKRPQQKPAPSKKAKAKKKARRTAKKSRR